MHRGLLLAGITALAIAAPAATYALSPVQQGLGPEAAATPAPPPRPTQVLPTPPSPPGAHAEVPPLPAGSSGYVWDPGTRRYVPQGGQAIWIPGHWENQATGQVWVDGRWMYRTMGFGP